MPTAYDTYDYPNYWEGREYEHGAEVIAIKSLLNKIPKLKKILEIGAGYGRLTPTYLYRSNKVIISDPSLKLLKIARNKFRQKKVSFLQSNIKNLGNKIKPGNVDLVILVRVLHHIENIDQAFNIINRLLRKNGYFILEFPNKKHLKAMMNAFFKGNFTFPLEIFPVDMRSKKSVRQKTIPFINYHPDFIKEKLREHNFSIIETRSVSNVRSPFIKRVIPLDSLLFIEKNLQNILAPLNFGPSIFILSKKVG